MFRTFSIFIALLILGSTSVPAFAGQVIQQSHQYTPGEVLVKYKQGISSLQSASLTQMAGVASVQAFQTGPSTAAMNSWVLVKLQPGMTVEQAMTQLGNNANVEVVEPNYIINIAVTPNDPSYSSLWGLHNLGQTGGNQDADIDAPEAWDLNTGSSSVLVAVIDTGVDYTHPDLAANMWVNPGEIAGNGVDDDGNGYIDDIYGYDFVNNDGDPMDDNSHGSHVSGTIAAVGNNGIGVVGVSWNASIMAVKFLSASGSGSTSGAISSVLYAANNGAKIMNNSWGGGGYSQALQDAITTADAAGALFVVAAGNSNSNNDSTPYYPANYSGPHLVVVAATNSSDGKAGFSSYGATTVHLGAPGVTILSTTPGNTYGNKSGTSMATPHVVGAAAVVLAANPGMTNVQLKAQLLNNVDPIPSMAGITTTGGRLNLFAALNGGTPPPPNTAPTSNPGGPYTGVVGVAVTFDGSASSDPENNALTYSWEVSFNQFSGLQPSFTFNAPGTYRVWLQVNDGSLNSAWISTTATITSGANQAPTAVAGGPYNGTTGNPVQLNGSGSSDPENSPLTYSWSVSDGRTLTGAQPGITFANAGSYTVTLIASDGALNSAPSTSSVTITATPPGNQPPVANPGGPYIGSAGVPVILDGSASSDPDNNPLTYSWEVGLSQFSGLQPSFTFTTPGTYRVWLRVNDGTANSNWVSTTATIQ